MMTRIRDFFRNQNGSVSVISSVGLGAALLTTVLSIDVGYIFMVQGELQNAADSAALSAVTVLPVTEDEGRAYSHAFSNRHLAGGKQVQLNDSNIEMGRYDFDARVFTPGAGPINAARVTATRDDSVGSGKLVLLFANVLGLQDNIALQETAVAAADPHVIGIQGNNHLIPYSAHEDIVDQNHDGKIDVGSEINMIPTKDAPGNFGYVDLDGGSNDIPELRKYIEHGFDQDFVIPPSSGHVDVLGSTGINGNSLLDSFSEVVGQTVFLPVHNKVWDVGSNANFRVTNLVAIQVEAVKLTGAPDKRYIKAKIVDAVSSGLIVDDSAPEHSSLKKLRLVE